MIGDSAGWNRMKGVFGNRSRYRARDVLDGTSNTLMFGESMGHINERPRNYLYSYSWMGAGTLPTAWGIGERQGTPAARWYKFSGPHPAGTVFSFVDGSTHLIANEIDSIGPEGRVWDSVYTRFSAMSDGEQVGWQNVH